VDPRTWQLVTFTLHAERPAGLTGDAVAYEVLHVSAPEVERLPDVVSTRITVP